LIGPAAEFASRYRGPIRGLETANKTAVWWRRGDQRYNHHREGGRADTAGRDDRRSSRPRTALRSSASRLGRGWLSINSRSRRI